MERSGFSPELIRFIRASIPGIDALEVLMRFLRDPAVVHSLDAVAEAAGNRWPLHAVREYLSMLEQQGLITAVTGGFRRAEVPADVATAVAELQKAYNERPVTLIRIVYSIADSRNIQSFADAFRLRKDEP